MSKDVKLSVNTWKLSPPNIQRTLAVKADEDLGEVLESRE